MSSRTKFREENADKFKSSALRRSAKIITAINSFSSLSNPYQYFYTEKQIKELFKNIHKTLNNAELMFLKNLKVK